jgi:hypothetical protein
VTALLDLTRIAVRLEAVTESIVNRIGEEGWLRQFDSDRGLAYRDGGHLLDSGGGPMRGFGLAV